MDVTKYVHIISHTHWDREWYLNSKYTNEWLVPFFESLFSMMEKEPEYRFVLDGQTSIIDDYFEQLEIQGKDTALYRDKIKKIAEEKRLIVGPYFLQPDWNLISEESIIRNIMIGFQTASEFGEPSRVGWLLDNFGQISQATQIHKEFGMSGIFLWRGVEMDPNDINSEFLWESPDGSVLPCVYFISSYRNAMRLAEYSDIMKERIISEAKKIYPFATTPNVLLMNGYDQEMVPDDIIPFIENGKMDFDDFKVIQSTPEEYMSAIIKHNPVLKKLKGELYSGRYISVFPGTLSSRMYLKIKNDICQKELEKYAEPLKSVVWCLGGQYNQELLTKSWKLLLKSHPHDSICGVSIDDVHTDMETRFDESYKISNYLLNEATHTLISNIDTMKYQNALSCYVVVNTSVNNREGVVAIRDEIEKEYILKDCFGNTIPFQKDESGYLKAYLKNIPGLGYTTLYALPKDQKRNDSEVLDPDMMLLVSEKDNLIENKFIKVKINDDGSLNVLDKLNNALYSNIAVFEDGADSGDEYNYSYPEKDVTFSSLGCKAKVSFEERGPLRATIKVVTVLDLPESLSDDHNTRSDKKRKMPIITWITIQGNDPVIKFRTQIHNTVKDHRVRVLFPTGIQSDVSYAETQFDVVSRKIVPASFENSNLPDNVKRIIIGAREPEPITIFPQRRFVDLSDDKIGAAVLNRGLPEYEILKEGRVIALTLFRGVNWIARDDLKTRIGDAGPSICVPDAQCLRTMEFHYAFYPHNGNWKTGRVCQHAEIFNTDLIVAKTDMHKGILKDTLEFVRLEDSTGILRVTAIKRAEDGKGIIIRLNNPSEYVIEGKIKFFSKITHAYYTNLNEEIIGEVKEILSNCVRINIKAKKIVTLKIIVDRENKIAKNHSSIHSIYRGEEFKEEDFSMFKPIELITPQQIYDEEKRAEKLENIFNQKEKKLEELKSSQEQKNQPKDLKTELYRIRLEVETYRRASLEARLSSLLIKKKYLENVKNKDDSYAKDIKEIEDKIRTIGYKLNEARVRKRAYEYITDFQSTSA